MKKKYDLIIVGSGPAGLTAGIYAARYNLDFLIIGKINGGAISEAYKVCNYPSQNNISGFELTQNIINHVKELGGEIKQEEVIKVINENGFFVQTNKEQYRTKKIILATGREKQELNIKGEKEFLGKGVSYCATCDAAFYKNKIVAVAGGGNAAITAALLLAEHAKKVYVIYRKDKFFRVDPIWLKQLEKEKKIKSIFNLNIIEIYGENSIKGIKLDNGDNLNVNGVFVEIGFKPDKKLSKNLNLKTEEGYIIADNQQKTNEEGIFAAGDLTNNYLKQIITACSEGAIAATAVYEELKLGKN